MTRAELLVRCLEQEGIRYGFGVPGEETLDVNEVLAGSSIQFIPVCSIRVMLPEGGA